MMHPFDRLLGWWSIDEGSREEQARLFSAGSSGSVFRALNTFIYFLQSLGNLLLCPLAFLLKQVLINGISQLKIYGKQKVV